MSKIVTFSPAYTLVPTYECFNRCTYCNFRTDLGKSPWLTLAEAEKRLESPQQQGISEILILSGEVHPQSSQRQAWVELIYQLGELALERGFLPHSNAGPLSWEEMSRLKRVNVSMGLMLEQLTPELGKTVHRHAPSKVPEVRWQQLVQAGELQIPFTTGLLLGIGETEADWWASLKAIALLHSRYGHIQEVILQPHSPGSQQTWSAPAFDFQQLPRLIHQARQILPAEITIQIPPNLVTDTNWLLSCLTAGARDLGGIVPKDEVNPDYHHGDRPTLTKILAAAGWQLVPRLPIYPQWDDWLSGKPLAVVEQYRRDLAELKYFNETWS